VGGNAAQIKTQIQTDDFPSGPQRRPEYVLNEIGAGPDPDTRSGDFSQVGWRAFGILTNHTHEFRFQVVSEQDALFTGCISFIYKFAVGVAPKLEFQGQIFNGLGIEHDHRRRQPRGIILGFVFILSCLCRINGVDATKEIQFHFAFCSRYFRRSSACRSLASAQSRWKSACSR
jgi:hypothetical protein